VEFELPKASRFQGEPLPENVFVDYFEPSFWNSQLTLEDQAHYIKNGVFISMPPLGLCGKWEAVKEWKDLGQSQIQAKYGAEVLKDYIIPTAEQLRQLEENQKKAEESDSNKETEVEEVQQELETSGDL
jgi:hypothetical protein